MRKEGSWVVEKGGWRWFRWKTGLEGLGMMILESRAVIQVTLMALFVREGRGIHWFVGKNWRKKTWAILDHRSAFSVFYRITLHVVQGPLVPQVLTNKFAFLLESFTACCPFASERVIIDIWMICTGVIEQLMMQYFPDLYSSWSFKERREIYLKEMNLDIELNFFNMAFVNWKRATESINFQYLS